MKSIPLGIESFEDLRKTSYYVDHTSLIESIEAFAPTSAILILRPRRFGKSLALSMLQSFFESDCQKRKALFSGLSIEKNKSLMALSPKPVIYLKFKDLKSQTYEKFLRDFAVLINEEYQRQKTKYDSALICPGLEKIVSETTDETALKNATYVLAKSLYDATGSKVYVFIDEYDTPISQAMANGYFDEASRFFQFLYLIPNSRLKT